MVEIFPCKFLPHLTELFHVIFLAITKDVCFKISNGQCLNIAQITTTYATNIYYQSSQKITFCPDSVKNFG